MVKDQGFLYSTKQIEFTKAVYEYGVPSYGSCWGIQMAAVAAGGEVQKNPKGGEWSIGRNICRTAAGQRSLLLKDKPDLYNGFVMHLDEVTRIPDEGTILAANDHCKVQALKVHHKKGTFWAAQYHPEYNLLEMAKLIAARATPLINEGFFKTEVDVRQYANDMTELHDNGSDETLKQKLNIGEDIIDYHIREQEQKWTPFLDHQG